MNAKLKKLEERKIELVSKLSEFSEIIEGSFFERRLNGHTRYYLSKMHGKQQRQHYISTSNASAVRQGNDQYLELLKTIKKLSDINLQLIKEFGNQ